MIDKLRELARRIVRSWTVWLAVVEECLARLIDNFDDIAAAFLDPTVGTNIQALIGTDTHMLAAWLKTVAIVTVIARAKSLVKAL